MFKVSMTLRTHYILKETLLIAYSNGRKTKVIGQLLSESYPQAKLGNNSRDLQKSRVCQETGSVTSFTGPIEH